MPSDGPPSGRPHHPDAEFRLRVNSARRQPLPHRSPPLALRHYHAAVRPETDQQPHPAAPRLYVVCFVCLGSTGPADVPHRSGRSAIMLWGGIHGLPAWRLFNADRGVAATAGRGCGSIFGNRTGHQPCRKHDGCHTEAVYRQSTRPAAAA
jgi:hypothetical protein